MDDEGPRVVDTDTGPTLRLGGVAFYPPLDPVGSAARRAAAVPVEPRTLVFVPSVGLGHGLAELLGRLGPGSAVLCVEVDQRVMALAAARGLPVDPRLRIVRTSEELAAVACLQELGPGRFRRVREAPLSGGWRVAPERYRAIRDALEVALRTWWRNRMTLVMLGGRLVRNLLDNLPLAAVAADADGLATGRPVVVAGAGPSLDVAVPALRSLRDRYVLVAADTALPALAAAGLDPDLVVCLEAQQANLRDFLPARPAQALLACELAGHPGVPRLFPGRCCLFSSVFAPLALLDRLAAAALSPRRVPALGSVGVAAAWTALRLTREAVLLAGLDFAYPRGATHARGTPSHLAALATGGRLAPAGQGYVAALATRAATREPSAGGSPVPTDHVLRSYRDLLASVVRDDDAARAASGLPPRIRAVGGAGLPCGAAVADPSDLGDLLGARAAAPQRGLRCPPARAAGVAAMREFLGAEIALADTAAAMLADRLSSSAPPTADEERLAVAVDYAWIDFPDDPDLASRGFLARAIPALAACRARLERAAASLPAMAVA